MSCCDMEPLQYGDTYLYIIPFSHTQVSATRGHSVTVMWNLEPVQTVVSSSVLVPTGWDRMGRVLGGKYMPECTYTLIFQYLSFLHLACAYYVHVMRTSCACHVHIMCLPCAHHVHVMCTSCACHVHIMCMPCACHVHDMC